jgi:mannose-6-phosphate isomerase-like protein (cupin superfamily)
MSDAFSDEDRPVRAEPGDRVARLSQRNLFQELMDLRDRQRQAQATAMWVIKERDIPVEINPLGRMLWYLHPNLDDVSIQALIVSVQELGPGEVSGKLHFQGGSVIFFLDGRGKTILDAETYEWRAGDLINTPLRPDGVTIQHFNTGSETVRFIEASPNLVHSLGVDRGSGFEVLEPGSAFKATIGQNG